MLYDLEDCNEIVCRIYEYLSRKVSKPPHSIKWGKVRHQQAVQGFVQSFGDTAGVEAIWDFLVFQFYFYDTQTHERPPLPAWFLGVEARRRYEQASEGLKFYAWRWASSKGLCNPCVDLTYKGVKGDVFRAERERLSQVSGPNYCFAKYGENAYNPLDDVCAGCRFESDCKILSEKNSVGETVVHRLGERPIMNDAGGVNVINKSYGSRN